MPRQVDPSVDQGLLVSDLDLTALDVGLIGCHRADQRSHQFTQLFCVQSEVAPEFETGV